LIQIIELYLHIDQPHLNSPLPALLNNSNRPLASISSDIGNTSELEAPLSQLRLAGPGFACVIWTWLSVANDWDLDYVAAIWPMGSAIQF